MAVYRIGVFLCLLFVTCYLLPTQVLAQSKEEKAIFNMNDFLTPLSEQCQKPPVENKGIFDKIWSDLTAKKDELFNLFLGPVGSFVEPQKLFSKSECVNNSIAPEQIQPKDTDSVVDQQKKYVGTPTGTYGVVIPALPDKKDEDRNIETDEPIYECAIVPCDQNVHPIVPTP